MPLAWKMSTVAGFIGLCCLLLTEAAMGRLTPWDPSNGEFRTLDCESLLALRARLCPTGASCEKLDLAIARLGCSDCDDGDPCTTDLVLPDGTCERVFTCVNSWQAGISYEGLPALGDDGMIYLSGRTVPVSDVPGQPGYHHRTYALDSANLDVQWGLVALDGSQCDVRSANLSTIPALSDEWGIFYINGDWNDGSSNHCASIFAKSVIDGSQVWASNPGGPHHRHPITIDDDLVYYGGSGGTLWSFDALSGAVQSTFTGLGGSYAGAAAITTNGDYVANQWPSARFARWEPDGTPLWNITLGNASQAQLQAGFDDGLAFVLGTDALHAVDLDAGALLWQLAMEPMPPALVDADTNVYLTVHGSGPQLTDARSYSGDGQLRWSVTLGEVARVQFLDADGTVYFVTSQVLHALDKDTGEVRWTYDAGSELSTMTASLTADGDIFLSTLDGTLHRLDSNLSYAEAAWPRPRGNRRNSGKIWDALPMP